MRDKPYDDVRCRWSPSAFDLSRFTNPVMTRSDYAALAMKLLKAALERKGVTYAQLVEKLAATGVDEREANIRNKLSQGNSRQLFCFNA